MFGWSPNGRYVTFAQAGRNGASKLAVVNVATRKVRTPLRLNVSPTASGAPDSLHLVVNSLPRNAKCGPTYRVSLTGPAPGASQDRILHKLTALAPSRILTNRVAHPSS